MAEYELKHPIKRNDQLTIEVVKYDRPKGKHLKKLPISALEGNNIELQVLYPFLCKWLSLSSEILDEMDAEDLFAIMEILTPFLDKSLQTGKK